MSSFLQNNFLLLATIIGAGIFSLPKALMLSGIIPFFILLLITAYFMFKINIAYKQIILSKKGKHQLPVYISKYLGHNSYYITIFFLFFSTIGALVAYLSLGTTFVQNLSGLSKSTSFILFFTVLSSLLLFGGDKLRSIDVFSTIIKIMLLFITPVIAMFVFFHTKQSIKIPLIGTSPFISYGIILFALTGFSIIPELNSKEKKNTSIISSQIITVIIYSIFAATLSPYINGEWFQMKNLLLKFIFDLAGFFSIFTPYLMISWIVFDLLEKDIKLNKHLSLIITVFLPYFLYLIGLREFVKILSFTGSVFLSSIAILISVAYTKRFKKDRLVHYLIRFVFIVGIIIEIFKFLKQVT